MSDASLDTVCINTMRTLAMDGGRPIAQVRATKSGVHQ